MKQACAWSSLILIVGLTFPAMSQRKEIIGYFPSWKWKSGAEYADLARVSYDKVTVLAYAFFAPLPDGTVSGINSKGDKLLLGDASNAEKSQLHQNLVETAHSHGVKVILSIGGWEDSQNFPAVAATEETRVRFAHSCVDQIRRYGFDGIDIDWEFPGFIDHKGTPADKVNFTLLLRTLRDSLDMWGKLTGTKYRLTIALPASETILSNYDIASIAAITDQIGIMTYDFSGSWSPVSGHNSPLFASRPEDSLSNVDAAFKFFTEKLKISPSKVNIGVPFYAQTFTQCAELFWKHAGADTVHFSSEGAFYYDIIGAMRHATRMWDDKAKVPYLISKEWNEIITYDDEESVGYKAKYIIEHGACGAIIWEITGDYMPDGTTPLLNVIYSKFTTAFPK